MGFRNAYARLLWCVAFSHGIKERRIHFNESVYSRFDRTRVKYFHAMQYPLLWKEIKGDRLKKTMKTIC